MGPGETHHRKQRERGQFSPLWRGLCRKQAPPPTWDRSLLLSSRQSSLWKGCIGRLWIFNFCFNPCIDVTLASIHILPSMWGSNCEGYPFGLPNHRPGSWVSAQLATLDSGRFPDLSSWHSPNWVGGICAYWNLSDSQWRWNRSWKTFGKSFLLFPPLRDLQSNQNIKG